MAESFAKKAALDIGELGTNLRDTARGFAEVSSQVERFAAAREANISIAQKELAVLNQGLATAKKFNSTRVESQRIGGAVIRTNSQSGGGVVASTGGSAAGVIASTSGKEIGEGVVAAMGRSTTAGERGIKAAINSGFKRLDNTIRTNTQRDGGAAFRAGGGV